MIQIRRILCPIDFSEFSRRALEHAVALGRWYEAEITVLHVVPFVPSVVTATFPPGVSPLALEPMPHDRILEELRSSAGLVVAAGLSLDAVVRDGSAVAEVVDLARTLPADLLVMGTHGRGGFERLVLGSVAEKVLRKANCPVLTVPQRADGAAAGTSMLFGRILCAVDFSPSSMKALDYALSVAQEAKASLTLLHVVEWSPDDEVREHRHSDVLGYRRHLEQEAHGMLRSLIPEEARIWCEPQELVAVGKAHQEILRVARETKAELIVMGVQGRGAVDLMLFGSTTHHVIRESHCPVLTIRGR
jgi:nucleotide-binding universal stress UspA family protein